MARETQPTLTWEPNGWAETPEGWQYVLQREDPHGEGVWHEAWFRVNGRTFVIAGSGSYGAGSKSRARAAAPSHYRARLARASN